MCSTRLRTEPCGLFHEPPLRLVVVLGREFTSSVVLSRLIQTFYEFIKLWGQTMTERSRMFLLISIMITVSLVVVSGTLTVLYRAALDEERERLVETAQSQARLIEAVARFDAVYSKDYPEGSVAATLSQIADSHQHYKGFGETGEFTLARREGDKIVFLLNHRHYDLDKPKPILFDSRLAEPMRRALSGQSGTVIGPDYRDEQVLAAYEPVKELNLGIVAKIDLAEIRVPFIKAGLLALGITFVVVLSGAALFLWISNPIIRRLEEHSADVARVNERLKQEIGERERAEEQIKASLKEKEVLLGEIHHRVKNNMQVIMSLLRLQAATVEDKKYSNLLKESQDRIQSMALIHEKLYRSENFARVDFDGYVKELARELFRSYGVDQSKIALKTEVVGVSLGLDNATPCALIINELVSNSLKYAFPEERKGEIEIAVHSTNGQDVELRVGDNGIGLPADLDFRNTESLGLHLVTILAENQLCGNIELNRTGGTTFHIQFKKTEDRVIGGQ